MPPLRPQGSVISTCEQASRQASAPVQRLQPSHAQPLLSGAQARLVLRLLACLLRAAPAHADAVSPLLWPLVPGAPVSHFDRCSYEPSRSPPAPPHQSRARNVQPTRAWAANRLGQPATQEREIDQRQPAAHLPSPSLRRDRASGDSHPPARPRRLPSLAVDATVE